MRIIEIKDIDKKLFNISSTFDFLQEVLDIPPIAISVEGVYIQVSGFSNKTSSYIDYGSYSKEDAVRLYSSFCNMNFFYITHILKISNIFGINYKNIDPLANISQPSIYLEAINLNRRILEYISIKNISPKVIKLINSFNSIEKEYISEYLSKNEPSLQTFKRFVENISDFDILPKDFSFPDKKSFRHNEIEKAFKKLEERSGLHLKCDESFESSRIFFEVDSIEAFRKTLKLLNEKDEAFEEYFKVLSYYDLC